MKISAVITANKFRADITKGNTSGIIPVFLTVALGIICGCIIYTVFDNSLFSSLGDYFISFATDFTNKNKPEIFSGLIISDIPYFVSMLILGTSALGAVPSLLLSFFKSAGIGAVATYLYTAYSLEGVEYCLLVLFPSNAVLLFAVIIFTHSCYVTSIKIQKLVYNKAETKVELQKYLVRSALIYIIFFLATVIRFIMIISFSSLFSFS